ncbi:unnamed protein product [Rotaria sp. Silwood2]|nr:unnamed protein product [Rotaria sp. Silwood2]CAF4269110.1 unnamed protein product [Rotaria sp. Silwood2]
MDQQNNTTESSSPSNDELEIQETEPIITTATTSEGLLSSSSVPKTARDKFFENLQHEKDKNRWSAKCLLCEKPKRVIDKLGVTSNFTRHAREYHKKQNDQWLNEFKNVNSIVQKHKITNHFQKKSHSPVHQSYGPNHTRQIQLSMAIVNDLIINLGLPFVFWFPAHAIIDGNFKSYVLSFVPLWGSHSGSLVLQKYEEIINEFGIKNKVIRIVTDSA